MRCRRAPGTRRHRSCPSVADRPRPGLVAEQPELEPDVRELCAVRRPAFMDANSLTQTWMGSRPRTVSTAVVQGEDIYVWFITEDDDATTKHHAVTTKVFHKSFQAKCDDGTIWEGVLLVIELMRGPDCLNGARGEIGKNCI
jgi:hypothetical protein